MRGTLNAGVQGAMLALMQVAMIGASLWLWARGQASVGDITFALTMFFMLQGYLREVGTDIRNPQRSINDMEELVTLERQPWAWPTSRARARSASPRARSASTT